MKTTPLFLLTFALTSCSTIDDLEIPDPLPPGGEDDDGGDEGGDDDTGDDDTGDDDTGGESGLDPDPKIPGAWQPCDGWEDQACSPAELGCFMPSSPGVDLLGHCTWICETDAHCADLQVNEKKTLCLPYKTRTSACQLPCTADDRCPEGMACHEVETDPGLTATICVWEVPAE